MDKPENPFQNFDLQGHRGARGLVPENTVPAFLKALEYDVTTLELDVVISKDSQIVVSHEPWMNHHICTQPNGDSIAAAEAMSFNLYQMTYDEIQSYDCGKKGNPNFPEQQPQAVSKPTLKMVVNAVNEALKGSDKTIYYNIETKSQPLGDNKFHPEPAAFVTLLYAELKALGILEQTTVQSFDFRTLQVLQTLDKSVSTAALVWEKGTTLSGSLDTLGFTPNIYSPSHTLVDEALIREAAEKGVKVIPWTVNEKDKMKQMISYGVDGLITDYPDRAKALLDELSKE